MGKFSVLLCDSDEVYVKRLANGLQKQFRGRIQVKTCSGLLEWADLEQAQIEIDDTEPRVDMLISSHVPAEAWQHRHPDCVYIWLDEGSQDQEVSKDWRDCVYKYQSVTKIARVLQQYVPAKTRGLTGSSKELRQRWYGVVSPVRHASMIPFACSLAGCLGQKGRTLLMVLMEFSGITQLLELTCGCGMESFFSRLRQSELLSDVPLPTVQALESFDLIRGPDNPMVLYELNERDITRLIERIQMCQEYDVVVWVGGNMMRGIGELFCRSEQIFSVERQDAYSRCCQREFHQFYKKLERGDGNELQVISLPVLSGNQVGAHLLWQWNHSEIGQMARGVLKEDPMDGTDSGDVSKEDFRTIGPKW